MNVCKNCNVKTDTVLKEIDIDDKFYKILCDRNKMGCNKEAEYIVVDNK